MSNTDEIDRKILAQLIENSKMQSKELSRKLKIHPNTLLQRLKKLEKSQVIKRYTAVVDFNKVTHRMQCIIFLNIKMIKGWEKVLRPLAHLPEVEAFILISGNYDIVVIARVKDEMELANLMRKLQDNEVVEHTTTHIIVDYYKQPYEYNPIMEEVQFSKK
ncbi:Lrp/AsnC family transcriptional regulator [Candidatus Micrarchaeota archaeon]|nr:Lrp/AsnC family transcriptional regulator [Candidatus Micrarchaeota archaeon]